MLVAARCRNQQHEQQPDGLVVHRIEIDPVGRTGEDDCRRDDRLAFRVRDADPHADAGRCLRLALLECFECLLAVLHAAGLNGDIEECFDGLLFGFGFVR